MLRPGCSRIISQCRNKKVDKRINRNHLTTIAFEAVIFHQFGNVPYIYKTSHVKFFLKMNVQVEPEAYHRLLVEHIHKQCTNSFSQRLGTFDTEAEVTWPA